MEYRYFYIIFIFFIILEFSIFILVSFFKKEFQWLITKKDEFPFKKQDEIDYFLKNSFSKDLGWDRKANTKGEELLDESKTNFKINTQGYRKSNNKYTENLITVFGDSYAFCRYVNDNSTWEHYLERKIKKQVRNYGVGNYGIDQALLKFDKTKINKKCKIIFLVFVPETISRIHSYWKHYSEFGNKFGFKPIFKLQKKKLIKIDNFLSRHQKIYEIKKNIKKIKKNDLFYKAKFQKRIFRFPYSICYLKNFQINNSIFFNLALFYFSKIFLYEKNNKFFNRAILTIIKKNILDTYKMYTKDEYTNLFLEIIKNYDKKIKKKKKKLVLIVIPQKIDVFNAKKQKLSYESFFEKLKSEYFLLDLTKHFIRKKNINEMYVNDKYAGHLSKKGNNFTASKIAKFLKKEVRI